MKTLCAQHLCKSYGGTQALRDVTLTLEPGHIYGIHREDPPHLRHADLRRRAGVGE